MTAYERALAARGLAIRPTPPVRARRHGLGLYGVFSLAAAVILAAVLYLLTSTSALYRATGEAGGRDRQDSVASSPGPVKRP